MIAGTLFNKLVDILEKCETLKVYVKRVFPHEPFNIEVDAFPCLGVSPVKDNDVQQSFGQIERVTFTVNVIGYVNSIVDPRKSIVGDREYRGIMDFANDVKAVILSSYQMGCNAQDTKVGVIEFFTTEDYSVRKFVMPVDILYMQTDGV